MYLQNYFNEPYFIGRLSGNEPLLVEMVIKKSVPSWLINNMKNVAGIHFTSSQDIIDYVKLYVQSCENTTTLCHWGTNNISLMEKQSHFLLSKLMSTHRQKSFEHARLLEPFYKMSENEYIPPFKNKKILIIHSHKTSILRQIQNIDNIFEKKIFDNCSFNVIQPPRQNAGFNNNKSWKEHWSKWKQQLDQHLQDNKYDTSLVAAGGYGMITCDFLFSTHKLNTLYIGGSLQLFFGIKGTRWNTHPIISKMYNKYWINVDDRDMPPNKNICENGCYW
jgi:hypothetical protein